MSDYLPKFKPGQAVTFAAKAAVTGGRIVEVAGNREVQHAGASSTKVVGVAGFDTAINDDVTVFSGGVQRLELAATATAGQRLAAAADGKATPSDTNAIAIALAGGDAGDVVDAQML